MSNLSFYILKFVPDPVRQEPRNLGILIWSPERVEVRFAGETTGAPLNFDGRRIGGGRIPALSTYKQWITTIRDLISSDSIFNLVSGKKIHRSSNDFVDALQTWCSGAIVIAQGGQVFSDSDEQQLGEIMDTLYNTYISTTPQRLDSPLVAFRRRGNAPEAHLQLKSLIASTALREDPYLIPKKTLKCIVRGVEEELEFSYAYENGALHRLIQTIELPPKREILRNNIQSSAWMFDQVLNNNIVKEGQVIAAVCLTEDRMQEPEVEHGIALIGSMAKIWNLADSSKVAIELNNLPSLSTH